MSKPLSMREYVDRLEKGLLDVSTGGVLGTKKQEKFIGEMIDAWPFLARVRGINNLSDPNYELNELQIADRQMRAPTAGTEPASGDIADWTITPRTLSVKEGSLYANVSKNWLMRNIEKENAEATVRARLIKSMGGNLLDLGFNGDTTDAGGDADFLNIADGWLKIADDDSAVQDVDTNGGSDYLGTIFPAMLAALPEKYRFSEIFKPVFLMNIQDADDYNDQVSDRKTARGDQALLDGNAVPFKGLEVLPVPYIPQGHLLLTPLQNLIWGIWEKLSVYREYKPRKHQLEFTLDSQFGFEMELPDALVYARDVA